MPGREAAGRDRGRAVHSLPAEEAGTEPRRSLAAAGRCIVSQSAGPGAGPSRLTWRLRRCPPHWRREPQSTCVFAELLPDQPGPAPPDPTRPELGPPWVLRVAACPRSCCCYCCRYVVSLWLCGGRLPAPPSATRPLSSFLSCPPFLLSSALPFLPRKFGSKEPERPGSCVALWTRRRWEWERERVRN